MFARSGSRVALLVLGLTLAAAPAAEAAVVAQDDFATVIVNSEDNTVPVVENDSFDVGASASAPTDPPHGSASCSGATCTYTPDPAYQGQDQFDYTVTEGTESDTGTVFVDVVPNQVDLAAYGYASHNPVGTGDPFSYHVSVYNQSPIPSGAATLQIQVPAGLAGTIPDGCTNDTSGEANDLITCSAGVVGAYGSVHYEIPLTAPGGPGEITVGANVTAPSPPDPAQHNNTTHETVFVRAGGDLATETWASDVDAGANVVFHTYTYNHGPKSAGPVVTTHTITGGTPTGASPNCVIGEPSGGATEVVCTAPEDPMPAFSSDSTEITVDPATDDAVVRDRAQVAASGNTDHEPSNNVSEFTAVSGAPALASISIEKWGAQYAVAGESHTYYLWVSNWGPSTANDVTVADTMPSGMTVSSVTTDTGTCTDNDTSVTCSLGNMAEFTYAYIEVVVAVAADASGERTNTATVSSTTAERHSSDNSSSSHTRILAAGDTDLELGYYSDELAAVNTPYTSTAYVWNNGPSAGTGRIEVQLPPGGYPSSGAGSPVGTLDDGTPCPFDDASNKVVCTGVSMGLYEYRSVDVTLTPNLQGTALVSASAILTSGSDPNAENNTRTRELTVVAEGSADLVVQQFESADPAAVGEPLEYTVAVTNHGPFAAPDVTISDTFPSSGVSNVSATREDGTPCPPAVGNVVLCDVGAVGVWDSTFITVRMTPTAPTPLNAPLTNTVNVAADPDADPDESNNSRTEQTVVNPDVADNTEAESATGQTYVDPETGIITISMPSGNRSALTVEADVVCPGNTEPSSVVFRLGPESQPGVKVIGTASTYRATFDAADLSAGDLIVEADCGPDAIRNEIGKIELYDPSGNITDATSGAPVVGATVTLYRVPGWSARTSAAQNDTPNTCESNLSKPSGADWSQPAPTDLGEEADPGSGMIDPAVNPQQTNSQGRYGWNVAAGCWYVVVSKAGYVTRTSPVVGVPPEVTDLDLTLTRATTGGDGGTGGGGTGGGTGDGTGGTSGETGGTTGTTTGTGQTPTTTPPASTPAATKCVVPKLVGLTLRRAKKALAKAKCGVGRITKKRATKKIRGKMPRRGTVIAQKPAPGTRKPAGSKVALVLAK